jgi:RNA polymerase sigma-70 factor (ECF subfamily)
MVADRVHGDERGIPGPDVPRVRGPLYAYVARRCGGERDLAEDVTQESFLRAVERWRRTGPPREPLAWLKTTARNLLAHHWRRIERSRVSAGEINLDELSAPPTRRAAAVLHAALARLRESDAVLLEAFHLDGTSTRELSLELGSRRRRIEGRLRRARETLSQRARSLDRCLHVRVRRHPMTDRNVSSLMAPTPDPEFVSRLEWQVRTAARRRERFARPSPPRFLRAARLVPAIVAAMALGASGPPRRAGLRSRTSRRGPWLASTRSASRSRGCVRRLLVKTWRS